MMRTVVVGASCAAVAFVVGSAVGDLASLSGSGTAYAERARDAVAEVGAVNTVTGVLFDLRALDTLGETLALFAAAAGVRLSLRELPGERRRPQPRRDAPGRAAPATSDALRAVPLALVPLVVGFAALLTLRAHLGVGGGLQGGALAVAALVLVFLAGRYRTQRRLAPDPYLEIEEAVGVGGYVVVGLVGLVLGGAWLADVLPAGTPGTLRSGGTLVLLSALVAIESRAALLTVTAETQQEPLETEVEGERP